MRRFLMLAGLALVASLAITGVAAASASAAEIFLTNAPYPQSISAKSGLVSAFTDGSVLTFTCSNLLGSGTLRNAKDVLLSLLWHGCKDNVNNTCQSAGEPNGLIHALVLALPVWLDKAQTVPGLLFERHQGNADFAHFTCGANPTALWLMRGAVLGHISHPEPKLPAHSLEVEVIAVSTMQEFEHPEENLAIADKLEISINGGAFAAGTIEDKKVLVEFTTAGVEAEFR